MTPVQDLDQVRKVLSGWWSMDEEQIVQTGQKMVDLQQSKNCRTVKTKIFPSSISLSKWFVLYEGSGTLREDSADCPLGEEQDSGGGEEADSQSDGLKPSE